MGGSTASKRGLPLFQGTILEMALFQEFCVWGNYYSLLFAGFDYNRHVHSIQQYIIYIYISIFIMIVDYWLIEHDV